MRECLQFYVDGQWVDPCSPTVVELENPATETVYGRLALGTAADVDRAVAAARAAFSAWSRTSRAQRIELLQDVREAYRQRMPDLGDALVEEIGAPRALAHGFQVELGLGHLDTAIAVLKDYCFERSHGSTLILKEPIGVCGLITPWNWPLSLTATKVLPALATGCTMVLKPSELTPFSARIFAEILDAAGVHAGVFNLLFGDGPEVGAALARHPGIDMISFTGSTRAGIDVATKAAPTVKRVSQELGGKSPSIILDDEAFAEHVRQVVASMMMNSGQTCSAPSRLLVPTSRLDEAIAVAKAAAAQVTVGDPAGDVAIGPVVSRAQFERIQTLIQVGIDEVATLIAGGLGRPSGLDRGYFVRPTIFANVSSSMRIAREEIFGPVLVILSYDSLDQAIEIANDSDYGLAGFVAGVDANAAQAVARRLRAGSVSINGGFDFTAPFGGYKMSGNGREWGEAGFEEFLETKAILGYGPGEPAQSTAA